MPNKKQVVFLREKSGVFKLRTDIRSFGFNEKQGQYYVRFNKADKVLNYKPVNVDVAPFTRQLEPPFRITRSSNHEVLFNVLGVRVYEGQFNKAYGVVFENGEVREYPSEYLTVEEKIDDFRSINVWEYLKEVARYNVIPTEDDKNVSLADKYAKLEFVAKNSLLESYLNVNTYRESSRGQSTPIFPFGCNRSQYKAVRNALENNLSVIQGPPGTGKTQTILNILANLILNEQTMEIVSNNNSAVENVREKLEANGLDFLCAQLGRASNKKDFIDHQTGVFPEMDSWRLDNARNIRLEANALSKELQEVYRCQEELANCSDELSEYRRQLDSFPQKLQSERQWPVSLLEKFSRICTLEMERKHRLSWWTRLRLRYHRLPATEKSLDQLQYLLALFKTDSLEKRCSLLKEKVKGAKEKNEHLRDISMKLLKHYLYRKYCDQKERRVFALDEIYFRTPDFLKEYPVVLSTTFSATSNINHSYKFDYIIIDEASQVDIAAGALALSCADNAVVVGDLKQLPNVVDAHTEEIVGAIFAKYDISEAYRYSTNSFLSSVCRLYPNIPQTLLREHYRCDPLIIGFCSKQFYNGELIPMKAGENEYAPIRVVRTVKGNHARGTVNYRQVETITQEILPELEEKFTDIGIIAPYNAQVDALHAALEASGRHYLAATVHKFQGRENDAIVLSTVDNQVKEFTDDPHLLNVAVSRAKKQFTLVVSADEQPDSNIKDLIDYIEYYQGKRVESKISSIFDLLYESYTQELLNFFRTHKRVSEYDSENLIYGIIQDVIKEKGLNHIGILLHYPLRHLITPSSNLTPEQRAYATRSWTHIDFLLYDTVSHKAKLAIEVDGSQYHKADSAQGKRDSLKDSTLSAIGLPILRLSTVGSQEKEKISRMLSA